MWSLGIAVLPGASLLFEDARARCEHLSQRAVSALARSLLAACRISVEAHSHRMDHVCGA